MDLILTFDTKEQEFMLLTVSQEIGEKGFLLTVFDDLSNDELEDLIKISVCQHGGTIMPFIARTNGKFYFNPEVNNDDETLQWCDWRDQELRKRIHRNSRQVEYANS